MICKLQFEKDIVFEIHNKMVHKIRNPNSKKIQIDCNLCGKRCQSKEKYKEHFNIQHNAKVFQATNRLLNQKEETISNLQKKIVENEKYTKQLEESVEKTSLCTLCVEERRNLFSSHACILWHVQDVANTRQLRNVLFAEWK